MKGLRSRYRSLRLNRDLRAAKRIVKRIDRQLHAFPHWKRKQFWRDFVKSEEFRKTTFDHTIIKK